MKATRKRFIHTMVCAGFTLYALVVSAQSVTLVAPAEGATVSLLKADMKSYLAMDRAARKAFFADAESRKRMRKCGDRPQPVVLKWTGPADTRYCVAVRREPDGKVFFKGRTSRTEIEVWNLEMARDYSWCVRPEKKCSDAGAYGRFSTEDAAPRIVKVDGIPNLRDLGGRKGLEGRRVKQGMVYRSAGLNNNANSYYTPEEVKEMLAKGTLVESVPEMSKATAQEIEDRSKKGKKPDWRHLVKRWHPGAERLNTKTRTYMRKTLGIKTDIDLRTDRECYGMKFSPLGQDVKWIHVSSSAYGGMAGEQGKKAFAEVFKVFLDEANYPIDFHCIAGADRTGSLAYILNAILGVDEEELWKDWEVTGFNNSNMDFAHASRFDKLVAVFAKYPGGTEMERVEAYVKEQGFTDADIAKFRSLMLERNTSHE